MLRLTGSCRQPTSRSAPLCLCAPRGTRVGSYVSPLHDAKGQSVPYAAFAGRRFVSYFPSARRRGEASCRVSSCCRPGVAPVLGTAVHSRSAHLGEKPGRRRGLPGYQPRSSCTTSRIRLPCLGKACRYLEEQNRDCPFQGCVSALGARSPLFLNKIQ